MAEIIPTHIANETETDKLIEITDKVLLKAYIDPPHGDRKFNNIVLRLTVDDKCDVALGLGPMISPKVLEHFTEDGELC